MRKISINTHDTRRPLLTEVLPYETPLFFSNEGFHAQTCREEKFPATLTELIIPQKLADWGLEAFESEKGGTLPYKYQIKKSGKGTRGLSLMHPRSQIFICDFYEIYSEVILALCSKSKFSLRRPVSIAEAYYGDSEEPREKSGNNYFEYADHLLLSQFHSSFAFQRLEKTFLVLMEFDISKCFDSIYTHSIAWAVRDKGFAKRNTSRAFFESVADRIFQNANWNETAGILVGPEASRIFAEIILQQVDLSVEKRLLSSGKRVGVDYSVKRYVDDYHVFAHSEEVALEIKELFIKELSRFRLGLNDSKDCVSTTPFMTAISGAKLELSSNLNLYFKDVLNKPFQAAAGSETIDRTWFLRNRGSGTRLIQKVKSIVIDRDVKFSSVSGILLTVLESNLEKVERMQQESAVTSEILGSALVELLDVVFYILAMDPRPSASYKVCRMILVADRMASKSSAECKNIVGRKCFEEIIRILEKQIRGKSDSYLEILNLLSTLRMLGDTFRVADQKIGTLLSACIEKTESSIERQVDYFFAISLLFYMGSDQRYCRSKATLIKFLKKEFRNARDHHKRTDLTCLMLDLVSCPYLTELERRSFLREFEGRRGRFAQHEQDELYNFISTRTWFSNWRARDNVEIMLVKKKFRSHYS